MADDYKVRNYQDELDTDPDKEDIITEEINDETLSEYTGVPEKTLEEEFDEIDAGDSPLGTPDDVREEIEDRDEELQIK